MKTATPTMPRWNTASLAGHMPVGLYQNRQWQNFPASFPFGAACSYEATRSANSLHAAAGAECIDRAAAYLMGGEL